MNLTLAMNLDNAAFEGDLGPAVAEILEDIANRITLGGLGGNIRDENGNTIGSYAIEENGQ